MEETADKRKSTDQEKTSLLPGSDDNKPAPSYAAIARRFLVKKPVQFFADDGPQFNYIGFVLRPFFAEHGIGAPIPEENKIWHSLLWNYLDGIQAFITSLRKALEHNHHESQAKALSALYLADGFVLFFFTCPPWIGRTAEGLSVAGAGWAFAFSMFVDFVNASVDLYNSEQRTTFEGWLKDSLVEAEYLKIQILNCTDTQEKGELEKRNQRLLGQIYIRCHTNPININPFKGRMANLELGSLSQGEFEASLKVGGIRNQNFHNVNKQIQKDMESDYQKNRITWAIKAASLTGMSLVAGHALPIPKLDNYWAPQNMNTVGFNITVVVALYYSLKYTNDSFQWLYDKAKHKAPDGDIKEKISHKDEKELTKRIDLDAFILDLGKDLSSTGPNESKSNQSTPNLNISTTDSSAS